MARRRAGNKSREEALVERRTWLLMAGFLILLSLFDPENTLPDWSVPLVVSIIILGSTMYQFMRASGWRTSPVSWVGGSILGFFGVYGLIAAYNGWPQFFIDQRLMTLVFVVIVILLGILTNEG